MKKAKVQIDDGRRLTCCVDADVDPEHYGILVTVPKAFVMDEMRDWVLSDKEKLVREPLPDVLREPSVEDVLVETILDLEYRMILMEMGVTL